MGARPTGKSFLLCHHISFFEWTIKVPSADFIEKTNVCVYRHGEDSVAFKFDIKIGEINIILRFENNKPVGAINIETKLYKTF